MNWIRSKLLWLSIVASMVGATVWEIVSQVIGV